MTRGARRDRTLRVVSRRVKQLSAVLIFGLDKQDIAEPHRIHKHKPKFTSKRASMQWLKRKANRATRHSVSQAVRSGAEDMPVESQNSVRWDYW